MSTNLIEADARESRESARGEPTWEVARFFPRQGDWTEDEFLAVSADHFVELNDGFLEVLPMPGYLHQAIVKTLAILLHQFVMQRQLGEVLFAPFPVRLWPGQIREPDIVFLCPERVRKLRELSINGYPDGADLVMEVISPGDRCRRRDVIEKRGLYARAGVGEYWIIDPDNRTITVLVLDGDAYQVQGEFAAGSTATSVLLSGFAAHVDSVFAAGDRR